MSSESSQRKDAAVPLSRPNLVLAHTEDWRPPAFEPPHSTMARLRAWGRRLLDLQAASIWRDMKRLLPLVRGEVLDVGCGAQPYREFFSPQTHILGIDRAAVSDAFGYHESDVRYFSGDSWPVVPDSVDVILSTETLEHVPDPARFLASAARGLKAGGRLILTVPFAARWHYIPYDYYRFTPSALNNLLSEAGFEDIAVYARGNAVTVACYKILSLLLPLLFPQNVGTIRRIALMTLGLATLPLAGVLALIGQWSLHRGSGDDCLGYTVVATRSTGGKSSC